MRLLTLCIFFVAALGCRATNDSYTKEVGDIENVSRDSSTGEFIVTCKRGSNDFYQERHASDAFQALVANNTICSEGGTSSSLLCEPWSSTASYLVRASDGQRLSDNRVETSRCNELVRQARGDFACAPYSSTATNVTSISTLEQVGARTSYETCARIVENATLSYVCSPWSSTAFNVVSFIRGEVQEHGSRVPLDSCIEILAASRGSKVFCKPWSSTAYNVARLADGEPMGQRVDVETCIAISEASTGTLTCEPWSSTAFNISVTATGRQIGSRVSLNECLTQIRNR